MFPKTFLVVHLIIMHKTYYKKILYLPINLTNDHLLKPFGFENPFEIFWHELSYAKGIWMHLELLLNIEHQCMYIFYIFHPNMIQIMGDNQHNNETNNSVRIEIPPECGLPICGEL